MGADLAPYRSKEEIYFLWWLDELKEAGFIHKYYYEPRSYILSEKEMRKTVKQLKTKEKIEERELLKKHEYTPDFVIIWSVSADLPFLTLLESMDLFSQGGIYCQRQGVDFQSFIDVKGTFNQRRGDQEFSLNRKWMYQRYKIFVNKVVPSKLFERTFTPDRYLYTDSGNGFRKLKYKPKTLEGVINRRVCI